MNVSKIVTLCDYAAKASNCPVGVWDIIPVGSSCLLRITCMTSIPASVHRAAQNDLKPQHGTCDPFYCKYKVATQPKYELFYLTEAESCLYKEEG
jgi:hypothetical protein